jgi:hypothetical protein
MRASQPELRYAWKEQSQYTDMMWMGEKEGERPVRRVYICQCLAEPEEH